MIAQDRYRQLEKLAITDPQEALETARHMRSLLQARRRPSSSASIQQLGGSGSESSSDLLSLSFPLESEFSGVADLETLCALPLGVPDKKVSDPCFRQLAFQGKHFRVQLPEAHPLYSTPTIRRVRVSGFHFETTAVLDTVTNERLADSSSRVESVMAGPTTCTTNIKPISAVPKPIIYVLVDFSDSVGVGVDTQTIADHAATAASFFASVSFNQMSVAAPEITPVLRMPRASTYYTGLSTGYNNLATDARSAATSAGYTNCAYTFYVIVFKRINFGWAGLGTVGSGGSTWMNGPDAGVLTHELGHNLNLAHSVIPSSTFSCLFRVACLVLIALACFDTPTGVSSSL